jgi:hypothetical protein
MVVMSMPLYMPVRMPVSMLDFYREFRQISEIFAG